MAMHSLILSTGSNLGDRKKNLYTALSLIRERIGEIRCSSGLYESEPWGYRSDRSFYNQCLQVITKLDHFGCIGILQGIEKEIGRTRTKDGYTDRLIDIDIIFFDDIVLDSGSLKIPHERMPGRRFVLLPLQEILPELVHPVSRKTISQLLSECPDPGRVNRVQE